MLQQIRKDIAQM
jgi:hypothetical protein